MRHFKKGFFGFVLSGLLFATSVVQAQEVRPPSPRVVNYWKVPHHLKTMKRRGFDIASIPQRAQFDEAPVFGEDQMPAYGNRFINQGYIYPYGFLDEHLGVNDDGMPAYPDAVIGFWTCRGSFIGNGAHTQSGPWIESTQYYEFYMQPGFEPGKFETRASLVSEGYELADVDAAFFRAVTGATGIMRDHLFGQLQQDFLGFTSAMGANLRFQFR